MSRTWSHTLKERYANERDRIAAAQGLLRHPDFPLISLLLSEIEDDAVVALRRGKDAPMHVAVIQGLDAVRQKIRLEATNSGLEEDPCRT